MMNKYFQSVIDKLESKYRNWKYKEDKYFKAAAASSEKDILQIELLKGKFKGIIYSYGPIRMNEDLGYKGMQTSFDCEVCNSDLSEKQKEEYLQDPKFCKLVGEILLVIIEKAVAAQVEKYYSENLNEENREDYFEEPVPRRTVRSKDSTVSEERVPAGKKRKNSVRGNSKVRSKVQSPPKP
jgi:hypothetical protein